MLWYRMNEAGITEVVRLSHVAWRLWHSGIIRKCGVGLLAAGLVGLAPQAVAQSFSAEFELSDGRRVRRSNRANDTLAAPWSQSWAGAIAGSHGARPQNSQDDHRAETFSTAGRYLVKSAQVPAIT